MRKLALSLVIVLVLCVGVSDTLLAQDVKFPAPSPGASVMQTVGITDVTVKYSSPGVKDRTIWGGLVPYDKLWRTGANTATTIEFSTDVTVGGTKVAKGKYALFTKPGKTEWTFYISKNVTGVVPGAYKEEDNVATVTAKPYEAPARERMMFGIKPASDSKGKVYLHWAKLIVGFKFEIDTKAIVMKSIEAAMGNWGTAHQAANYAFRNGMLDKAKEWVSASLKVKEVFWNRMLKTRILKKMGADKAKVAKSLAKAKALIEKLPSKGQKDFATGQVAAFEKGK
ncbi:MAG: DUF2911 domain-containing protein [bacterium]|nr:DUF2911 domain-containing protein [bacterium]